jgi:hypothetical protein
LKEIDVSGLNIFVNPCDLRKDLHTFVDYIKNHAVKRATRSNSLPKTDARRIAKLITDPDALMNVEKDEWRTWLMYVDGIALRLGFVDYDTKGEYKGYSSVGPSFMDNFIEYKEMNYNNFLSMSLLDQERLLFETLITDAGYSKNELFLTSIMGTLDSFDTFGCATGVLPCLDFVKTRRTLFNILKSCKSNVWYSSATLVQYLKTQNPFFLIPEKPSYKHEFDKEKGRYCNFREGKRYRGKQNQISPDYPDAFERVEGRYVERFLEGMPLTLGYVSVAYDISDDDKKIFPLINHLKAFRVSESFLRFMEGKVSAPKTTVQPNFEIFVESEFYPASILKELSFFTETISTDTVAVLKLQKKKAIEYLANNESVDIIELLSNLSDTELPGNVLVELDHWAGHSEKFIIYSGFGLLEGGGSQAVIDDFTVERITPSLRIVKDTEQLFSKLERKELAPILAKHSDQSLNYLPDNIKTIFSHKNKTAAKPKKKKSITLKRETNITLYFPNESILKEFRSRLIRIECPFRVDPSANTITYLDQHKVMVMDTIKALRKDLSIKIKDING